MDEKELKRYVGNRIREERRGLRLSQKEFGEKIGVKHNTVSQYENATNSPEQDTLFKIARALGIKVDDLFPPRENTTNELERALNMTEGMNVEDVEFLNQLIQKTLNFNEEERAKFLESIRFTVEFYDKMRKDQTL